MFYFTRVLFIGYLSIYNPGGATTLTTPNLGEAYDNELLFHHDLGLFLEPSSFAYSYSTFVYERIHMLVPLVYDIGYHISNCNDEEHERTRAEVSRMLLRLQDSLSERIDEYESPVITEHNKEKREIILLSLLAAAAIMSVGLSLYNSYQISSLSSETDQAVQEINRLSDAAKKTPDIMNRVIDQLNNITVVIPELGKKINTVIATLNCEQSRSAFFRELDREVNNDVLIRVTSGINALYSGKITPDFYPIERAKKTLLSRDDMVNSLYRDDISLVYKLGNFVTLSVRHKPFSITGVLILPKLLRENIGVTLMINKVPIHGFSEAGLSILDEPDVGVQDLTSQVVWTPDMSLCLKHTGTFFCPLYDVKSKYSRCLTGIVFGKNASSCVFRRTINDPMIKQASNGLLLGSEISEFSILSKDRDGNSRASTRKVLHQNSSNLITVSIGREILIQEEVYMLAPETAESSARITLNNTSPIPPLKPIPTPDYVPIPHMDKFDPHYLHYMGFSFSGLLFVMIFALCLCIYYVYHQHRQISRLSRSVQLLERHPLVQ